jgi:hypothetical protein
VLAVSHKEEIMQNKRQEYLSKALIEAGVSDAKAFEAVSTYDGIPNLENEVPTICPLCGQKLIEVTLSTNRKARYCTNERAVYPYPIKACNEIQVTRQIKEIKLPAKEGSIFAG